MLDSTKVTLRGSSREAEPPRPLSKLEITGIHGMDAQMEELNDFLLQCQNPRRQRRPKTKSSCAVVIHGDAGSGKTMLLDRVAQTGWGGVHRIEPGDKLSAIQETFQKAREQHPSIITLDRFERLIDKDRNNRAAVIQTICDELDKLSQHDDGAVTVPRVAVLVACLDYQTDVPPELRKAGRLDEAIFLPLPDVECRKAILRSLDLPLSPGTGEQTLARWSERTHAYNGEDLHKLIAKAARLCHSACVRAGHTDDDDDDDSRRHECCLSNEHFEQALRKVRPAAMHDVNLKPRPVRWDDIRGQAHVKRSLRLAVRMLNEQPAVLRAVGLASPRGVLLYGPPGCSKTMAAQAMATESGLNFFAVKGAELLNMYVGESERALRRLFQRARGAAPAMIFFDEIDAIGGQRSGMGGGSGSGSGGGATSHGSLNVITTLLTEMDGFELLKGVLVVAATNRPQILDPALLRPGRFDELIYVPPPDPPACEAMVRGFLAGLGSVHVDVDAAKLAWRMNGYSGAEIDGILRSTARAVYERSEGGLVPDFYMADFVAAIEKTPKRITPQMLEAYREWEHQFKK